ncbi:MAG: sigma-70 family RNA polymerase sigma factor [Wenzhouxiangellaceae bacterium]|nr:sigma-70 family RNA polymerase sigma factor [Wenzhouxiangellaceae bacterium]
MKRRFEHLVDEHGGRLYQLARLLLGRDDEAEDVVQDSLVKLWRHLPGLRAGQELAWLMTCTRNACLDVLRGKNRKRALLWLVAGDQRAVAGDAGDEPAPEASLARDERVRALRSALAAMPEPGRSLLILRDIQELDVATVARTLELSENQVKVYTFRARRALRARLEEKQHEQVA